MLPSILRSSYTRQRFYSEHLDRLSSSRFTRGEKRGNSRDPPQGCQTPAEPEPKYQTLAYSSIEGPDDLSTAYYTSHRPCANFFLFLTRVHSAGKERFKGEPRANDDCLVSAKLIDETIQSLRDGGGQRTFPRLGKKLPARDPASRPRFSL